MRKVVFSITILIISSDFLVSLARLVLGDLETKCLTADGPCVGEHVSDATFRKLHLFDRIGGLTVIFCGEARFSEHDYLFVADLLEGERCDESSYSVAFSNTTTRTLIRVKEKKITHITRGPLHAFDP